MRRWFHRRSAKDTAKAARPVPESAGGDTSFGEDFIGQARNGAADGEPEAMANLGAVFYQQGRLAEAVGWTERAWQAGNVTAGFNLGTFYLEMGDTHRADLVWTRAGELGDPDAMMCAARLALRRGDRTVADRWVPLILNQDQPYPITALGVAFRDHGDWATALRIFDRAITLGDGYAMDYAAAIHQRDGDLDRAAQLRALATDSRRYGWGIVESSTAAPSTAEPDGA